MEFLLTRRFTSQLRSNWYGNLLVFPERNFGRGDEGWTAHSFPAFRSKEENHLLELRRLVGNDSVDISKFIDWEIRRVGVVNDCYSQQSANRDSRNPQDGNTDKSNGRKNAPVRPFLVLRSSQLTHPRWIIRSVVYQIHERREENRQHGKWADVLPAQHPVHVRPTASHQLDVISKPSQSINVTNRNALKVWKVCIKTCSANSWLKTHLKEGDN